MPVFGRASIPRTARGRIIEESFQEPMKIGDVDVNPGDLVLADGSGVVFIAADKAEEVLEAAEMIAGREAKMKEAVLAATASAKSWAATTSRCSRARHK